MANHDVLIIEKLSSQTGIVKENGRAIVDSTGEMRTIDDLISVLMYQRSVMMKMKLLKMSFDHYVIIYPGQESSYDFLNPHKIDGIWPNEMPNLNLSGTCMIIYEGVSQHIGLDPVMEFMRVNTRFDICCVMMDFYSGDEFKDNKLEIYKYFKRVNFYPKIITKKWLINDEIYGDYRLGIMILNGLKIEESINIDQSDISFNYLLSTNNMRISTGYRVIVNQNYHTDLTAHDSEVEFGCSRSFEKSSSGNAIQVLVKLVTCLGLRLIGWPTTITKKIYKTNDSFKVKFTGEFKIVRDKVINKMIIANL